MVVSSSCTTILLVVMKERTREETSFKDTNQHPQGYETLKGVHESLSKRTDTPEDHDDAEPGGWRQPLQDQIARNLEENVRNEEHEEGDVVVCTDHFQVLGQALDLCIADIGPV